MESHTAKERKLKTDIIEKNILRRDLKKKFSAINRWKKKLNQTNNLQKRKKMESSIVRYQDGIEPLMKELLHMGEDLEKRIKDEMNYSEEEITAFQTNLEKHAKELERIQDNLKKEDAKPEESDKDRPSQGSKFQLAKLLKEEVKKMRKDEKELKSEERDKALFTLELKRIALDRKIFGS